MKYKQENLVLKAKLVSIKNLINIMPISGKRTAEIREEILKIVKEEDKDDVLASDICL